MPPLLKLLRLMISHIWSTSL